MIELFQQNAGTAGSGIAGCLARLLHYLKRRFQTNPRLERLSKLRPSAGLLAPCLVLLAGSGLLLAQTAEMVRTAMRPSIEGSITILDQDGKVNAVPGALVNLTASASTTPLSTATDIEGRYRFTNLPPGTYRLDARLDGFTPFTESVAINPGEVKTQDVRLELAAVVQKIDVQDQAPPVAAEAANSSSTLSSPQFTSLPLAEQKFKAALPLVPGVVRTREGQLNFKGAP
jgi:hypothetical protein